VKHFIFFILVFNAAAESVTESLFVALKAIEKYGWFNWNECYSCCWY